MWSPRGRKAVTVLIQAESLRDDKVSQPAGIGDVARPQNQKFDSASQSKVRPPIKTAVSKASSCSHPCPLVAIETIQYSLGVD